MNLSEGVKVISLAKTRMYEMEELEEAEAPETAEESFKNS